MHVVKHIKNQEARFGRVLVLSFHSWPIPQTMHVNIAINVNVIHNLTERVLIYQLRQNSSLLVENSYCLS